MASLITLHEVTKTYTLGRDRSVEAVRGVSLNERGPHQEENYRRRRRLAHA